MVYVRYARLCYRCSYLFDVLHRIWYWLIHINYFYDRIFFTFLVRVSFACSSNLYQNLPFWTRTERIASVVFAVKLSICLVIMKEFFFWRALRDHRGSSWTNEFFSTAVNIKVLQNFFVNISQWTVMDKNVSKEMQSEKLVMEFIPVRGKSRKKSASSFMISTSCLNGRNKQFIRV